MAITADGVRGITGSELDDASLAPFITAAECILENIADCIEDLSDACEDQLGNYLASHLLATSAVGQDINVVKSESLRGKYSVEYLVSSTTGEGMLSTMYGRTANALSNGCLAEVDKRPINLFSLGSL